MQLLVKTSKAVDFPPRKDGTMRKRKAFGPEDAKDLNPFLSLMEDWMKEPGGYMEHIHKGHETLTLVLDGEVEFTGHAGASIRLHAGDAQWALAGEGLSHAELPRGEAEAHILQLWVNLPTAEKKRPARLQNLLSAAIPSVTAEGRVVRVVAGTFEGTTGPAEPVLPVRVLDVSLDAGGLLELAIPSGQVGSLFVVHGDVAAGTHRLASGGLLHFTSKTSDTLPIASIGKARLLLVHAPPLLEPVEVSGPFVMNTKAEVKKAYDEFRGGFYDRLKDGPPSTGSG